ncbi:2-oxoglutarate [Hirschfeldia incana]|nr:2-oxoglutarate [Hirschfeldia incana]
MSLASESTVPTVTIVTVTYSELKDSNIDLSAKIEQGFGPNGLGILTVKDVPGYSVLRQNLLRLAPKLACLPDEVKRELGDAHSRYNFGWSHGKEKLESGKLDMLKGSYYANPLQDVPTSDSSEMQRYPWYCGSNIWPSNSLPELEGAFKALGKLMFEVGLMVAYHCDLYVSKGIKQHEMQNLENILLGSRCHKGRLLYYFPAQDTTTQDSDSISSWCGWHTDHGSLTGLTRAIFSRNSVEVPCPDPASGLYIRTRSGQVVKVVYGEDEIAYQIGETTSILSRGYLCATPHCVRAPQGEEARGLERSTFALFMQPDWDQKLTFPKEVTVHEDVPLSNGVLTFGEYTEKLLNIYYDTKP